MNRRQLVVLFVVLLGVAGWAALTGRAVAQYRCAVAIDLKGKAVLAGEIRDTERPRTNELWELLKTLSFNPTKDGQALPDPKSVERTKLEGEIRVRINGAGQVQLKELSLVRNKLDANAWVIAPEDVARILKLRNSSSQEQPKK
jgi:hypothetical protein